MRVIAILALLCGAILQFLLNGQEFSNALFGAVCGITAVACGLLSLKFDPAQRTSGRIFAWLGAILVVWCLVGLPGAYRRQARFNELVRQSREMRQMGAERAKDSRSN